MVGPFGIPYIWVPLLPSDKHNPAKPELAGSKPRPRDLAIQLYNTHLTEPKETKSWTHLCIQKNFAWIFDVKMLIIF